MFLPNSAVNIRGPTDARLAVAPTGAFVVTIPVQAAPIEVDWVEATVDSQKQLWVLLSGVVIGLLGGVLGSFLFDRLRPAKKLSDTAPG